MATKKNEIVKKDEEKSFEEMVNSLPDLCKKKGWKHTCKVYQSQYRQEAEQEYENSGGNVLRVYRFLKNKGEDISRESVRRYFLNYYVQERNAVVIKDYVEDLMVWKAAHRSKTEKLSNMISMAEKMMFELSAHTEPQDTEKLRRTADTVSKIMTTVSTLQKQLDDHEAAMEPAVMLIEKLRDIITRKANEHGSGEVSNALYEVLVDLEREWGAIDHE